MATSTVPSVTTPVPHRQSGLKANTRAARLRQHLTGYAFVLPSMIGVIGFLLIPILIVIGLSFFQWNMLDTPKFVGLSNFIDIFKYEGMGHALLVTCYYVLLNIPLQTVLALLLALAVVKPRRGGALLQTVAVLPYLATPVALGIVWKWFFDPNTGIINTLLAHVGVHGPFWLSSSGWAMPVVAMTNIWQYVGYNMLFFIAGLKAISPSIYEAAAMDGSTRIKAFFGITLPLLRPTMLFVLVTGLIGSFQIFDTVFVLTQGGPGSSTTVVNYLIYQTAFVNFRIGAASAMSVVLFLVILAVTGVQFLYFRRRTTYETM